MEPAQGHLEDSDRTLGQAVRHEIAEETGVTELEVLGDGRPEYIDVHTISVRPDGTPARVHHSCRAHRHGARGHHPGVPAVVFTEDDVTTGSRDNVTAVVVLAVAASGRYLLDAAARAFAARLAPKAVRARPTFRASPPPNCWHTWTSSSVAAQ
ncbi:hypothetical protein JQK87_09760 [Streptomyces sp. G44]|uniref:NUDIX domain-containing protein n=1 Tax=Streptomyces sp. G44 TaxID=2807632 RepID=UPI00195FB3FB|nr:NUDIX domain-containing protein [Streptomyces sp. G44]MBM7168690.1 hypothetical protein [Streptomyces sp. G44]